MPRRQLVAAVFLLAAAPLHGAIWPEGIDEFTRTSIAVNEPSGPDAVLKEYGLQEVESATYEGGKWKYRVQAWRAKDSTGAIAFFQMTAASPATAAGPVQDFVWPVTVKTPGGLFAGRGNYVLRYTGYAPSRSELEMVFARLPEFRESALPSLPTYLPTVGRLPNSVRYLLGPDSLRQFLPEIGPELAKFDQGAEGQTARFRVGGSEGWLAVFSYPTHHIARERVGQFGASGFKTRRSGPLVAVFGAAGAIPPADLPAVDSLLAKVEYRAIVMLTEQNPLKIIENTGDMLISIFILIGVLLVFCLGGGLAFAAWRSYSRRGLGGRDADPMVLLRLEDR